MELIDGGLEELEHLETEGIYLVYTNFEDFGVIFIGKCEKIQKSEILMTITSPLDIHVE